MRNYSNLTLTIPHDLADWLKEYKRQHCISLSAVITKILEKWRQQKNV
jgi:hypothetical protein